MSPNETEQIKSLKEWIASKHEIPPESIEHHLSEYMHEAFCDDDVAMKLHMIYAIYWLNDICMWCFLYSDEPTDGEYNEPS